MAGRVPVAPRGSARPVVYGRVTPGRRWLQYWLFYADNPQDRGVLKTGRHAGDWELVQLRLDRRDRPRVATLSQHSWAEACAWGKLRRRGPAPVVYVTNGSHANYSRAGTHDRPWPDPNDKARGNGRSARPPVAPIGGQRWARWPGRWGESRASWVPGEQSSPRGPRFADGGAWSDPDGFHAARAESCAAGPPGRPWQWPALVAALATAGGAGWLLARARRAT